MKRSGKIVLFGISIVAVVAALVAASVIRANSIVGGLTVRIDSQGLNALVTTSEVENLLLDEFPGLTSSRVKDVSTRSIESFLSKNPYVETVHAAVSVGGRILVNIVARRPIARVFYGNSDFYIDRHGRCFLSRRSLGCDVPVVSGHFRQKLTGDPVHLDIAQLSNDTLRAAYDIVNVWRLAKFLDDPVSRYNILYDQIFVDVNGDLIMQPRLGGHEVVVGSADNLEEKFRNLKIFYAKGLPHAGYDSYSRVSVKFDGQVVCTKRKQIK
ncbi:MAG: hypothetical protein J5526_08970 [Bacteroidales bacterium]|nr:hypothetical protein [Bacteroidales bacterium]